MKIRKVLLFILVVFVACNKKNEVAKYQIIHLRKDISLSYYKNDSVKFHIEIKLPQIVSYKDNNVMEEINFEINKSFFGENDIAIGKNINQNFDKLVESYRKGYEKDAEAVKKKFPRNKDMLNYKIYTTGAVIYNKNKVFSISSEVSGYTGGAHSVYNIAYLHFDLNSGQSFGLDDLFDKAEKEKLVEMVSAKCELMKKNKGTELFDDAKIESCDNFYFDDKDFIFVYNPYEIAPFSAGYIKINIPISDIKPLLKKGIHPTFIEN